MKKAFQDTVSFLNLNINEQIIFKLLEKYPTPISLAKNCSIPRPTIYITLEKLARRGLVLRLKRSNKKIWIKNTDENIEKMITQSKTYFFDNKPKLSEKISISDNLQIYIHKGKNQIIKLLTKISKTHSRDRLIMISGDLVVDSWKKVLGVNKINSFNRDIKKYKIITELITSKKWFEDQTKDFGINWAKDFEGRTTQVQNIDNKYLNYASQIFIIKDQVYLVSMADEVFIEIKNNEIAKLLISLTRFIQDHSSIIDPNALLRELIQKTE